MRIFALAGLPGTGKSALARELATRLGAPLLDKDRVRAALFAPGEIEYSREQDDLVIECVYRAVEFHARRGAAAVVLDGRTYARRDQVDALRALARRTGSALVLVECVAEAALVRARLERDAQAGTHPARNRSVELYERLRREAEPIAGEKLVLSTDGTSPEELATRVLARAEGFSERAVGPRPAGDR